MYMHIHTPVTSHVHTHSCTCIHTPVSAHIHTHAHLYMYTLHEHTPVHVHTPGHISVTHTPPWMFPHTLGHELHHAASGLHVAYPRGQAAHMLDRCTRKPMTRQVCSQTSAHTGLRPHMSSCKEKRMACACTSMHSHHRPCSPEVEGSQWLKARH